MLKFEFWQTLSKEAKQSLVEYYGSQCSDVSHEEVQKAINSIRLFDGFLNQAHQVLRKRNHYGANTIIEVLRHHSLLEDDSEDYKISNDIAPVLSRLSMQMFPALDGFFKLKPRTKNQ